MNPDQPPAHRQNHGHGMNMMLWRETKAFVSGILGEHEAHLFLGCLLAYPIHAQLLAKFRSVPGIWLHGDKCSGKTLLTNLAACFFIESPDQKITLEKQSLILNPDQLKGLHPHPPILDDYSEPKGWMHAPANQAIRAILQGSFIDDSALTEEERCTPPIVAGERISNDRALSSHYLHFETFGLNPHAKVPDFTQLHKLLAGLSHPYSHRRWLEDILQYAPLKGIQISGSNQSVRANLAIAIKVFLATDTYFGGSEWRDESQPLLGYVNSRRNRVLNPKPRDSRPFKAWKVLGDLYAARDIVELKHLWIEENSQTHSPLSDGEIEEFTDMDHDLNAGSHYEILLRDVLRFLTAPTVLKGDH